MIVAGYECYLPLADLVDLERERARIQAELAQLEAELERAQKLLANNGFVSKAPAAVVQKERDKVAEHQELRTKLMQRLASLGG